MVLAYVQVILEQKFATEKVKILVARHNQGLALFGPFNGCGTADGRTTEVGSDAERIAKTGLTSKPVPFVDVTAAQAFPR